MYVPIDDGRSRQVGRVLVVEDSAALQALMVAILLDAGYIVETADNGREGLLAARARVPDIILSDLEMPEMDGCELLNKVRTDAALPMIPFVMITSVADRASTRRAMVLGADDYVTKPVSPDELLAVVRRRLASQQNWQKASAALAQRYSHDMMAILPHEFRTPLNSILGFSELMAAMAEEGLSPEQTQEFAGAIQRAGKRLLSHTSRFLTLLDYQGALPKGGAWFALDREWAEAVARDVAGASVAPERVRVEVRVQPAPLACREDVMWNLVAELLDNAGKFADPDSVVTLHGAIAGNAYRLSIESRGRPFPLQLLQEPQSFRQFERDLHEQQGLGIGLAIVHHALRLSGTTMRVENLPERRVRMELETPLAE